MGAYDELKSGRLKKAPSPTEKKGSTKTTKAVRKPTFKPQKSDLSTAEGLESFALKKGLKPPEPSKFKSAVSAVARGLNIGTAITAGAVRGAVRPEISLAEGVKEGVKKNLGFGDIIREDLGIKPKTLAGKVAVGTVSLAADILFDPLTYVTFGSGAALKVGGKALSKPATRLWLQAMKESNQSRRVVNTIISEVAGTSVKKGARAIRPEKLAEGFTTISKGALEAAQRAGVSAETIGKIARLGGDKVFDKGGIKLFGRTVIGSQALRNLPGVKQVADVLATSERVKEAKDTLGKLFVFNYGTNPKLQETLLAAGRAKREAVQATVQSYEQLFKKHKLNDSELLEFALKGRESMKRVLEVEKELVAKGVEGARRIAKERVAKEGVQFSSPKLQAFFDDIAGEGGHMQQLQRLAGLPDEDAFKFYFPNIKKDKVESLFLGRAGPKSAKKEYLKKFGGKLTDEEVILDPLAAYSKRQIQVVTERIDSETSKRIARGFGRSFPDKEAAEAAGYVEFKRKTFDGEVSAYIPKEISDEVNAFYQKGTSTIDKLAKISGFDWFTRMWKGYVTSLFPAFHIRNMTSNGFLNMTEFGLAAFNPKTGVLASQLALGRGLNRKIMSKTGKYYTGKEIIELAQKEGILGTGAFGAVEQLIEEAGERAIVGRAKRGIVRRGLKQLGPEGLAFQAGRKVGGTVEDQAKLVGFITSLAQGHGPKEAAKRVRRAVFDYSRLTDFEKSVMRRLIPFYSFMRFNAEGQIRSLLTTPGRTAGTVDFIRNVGQTFGEPLTEEDLEGIPPYALAGLGIKWGKDKEGRDRFITGFGLPIEAFLENFSGEGNILTNTFKGALNDLNPAFKMPIEAGTGQDLFRGRAISEIYNAKDLVSIMEVMPKPVANELKDLLEWSEQKNSPVYENGVITGYTTKYTANPYALWILRNLPTSRIQQTISMATDPTATPGQKALRGATGIRVIIPDQEEERFWKQINRSKQLTAWLKRLGYAGEFIRPYEKKDVEVQVGGE